MKLEMDNLAKPEIFELFGSAVAPAPVALISTVGEDGIHNAAPVSLITLVCYKPPIICVSIGLRRGQKKDTSRNIEFSKDFVVNIMDETLIKPTIQASADYPSDVDEIKEVGFTAIASDKVKSPRVAESQVSLECQLVQSLELEEEGTFRNVVFAKVVVTHIKDELWVAGKLDPSKLRAVGRVGVGTYCRTRDIFKLTIT